MTNLKTGLTVAVLMGAMTLPGVAQKGLTHDELLQLAVCSADLASIDAVYETATRIIVTCGAATGFVPLAGGLGAAGAAGAAGLGLVLTASGSDDTDSSTSTTN